MTPTPDVPLLRKAVEWVEEQDRLPVSSREWLQPFFVLPAPGDPRFDDDTVADQAAYRLERIRHERLECGTCYCVAGYVDHLAGRDSDYAEIPASARELLGLDTLQAQNLFHAGNDAATVRRIAEDIAGEPL